MPARPRPLHGDHVLGSPEQNISKHDLSRVLVLDLDSKLSHLSPQSGYFLLELAGELRGTAGETGKPNSPNQRKKRATWTRSKDIQRSDLGLSRECGDSREGPRGQGGPGSPVSDNVGWSQERGGDCGEWRHWKAGGRVW